MQLDQNDFLLKSLRSGKLRALPPRPLSTELVSPHNLPDPGEEPQYPPPLASTRDSQVCGTKGICASSCTFPAG